MPWILILSKLLLPCFSCRIKVTVSLEKLPKPINIREAINSFMKGEIPQELPKCRKKFTKANKDNRKHYCNWTDYLLLFEEVQKDALELNETPLKKLQSWWLLQKSLSRNLTQRFLISSHQIKVCFSSTKPDPLNGSNHSHTALFLLHFTFLSTNLGVSRAVSSELSISHIFT